MAWSNKKRGSATKRAFIAGLKAGLKKKKSSYSKYGSRGYRKWR